MPLKRKIEYKEFDEDNNILSDSTKTSQTITSIPEVERPTPSIKSSLAFTERTSLPSSGFFYEADLAIRPFSVPDVALIAKSRVKGNLTPVYDALDNTININVRTLCMPDVKFLLYWQRINSYTKRPFMMSFTSLYGNQITQRLTNSNLKINSLTNSEELQEYLKRFTWPTIADEEAISVWPKPDGESQQPEEILFKLNRAACIKANSFAEKMAIIETMSPDDLADISDFKKLLNFGVEENITVIDPKFDLVLAKEHLNKRLADLNQMKVIEYNNENDATVIALLNNNEAEVLVELERLEQEGATAKKELKIFNLNVADFFPDI